MAAVWWAEGAYKVMKDDLYWFDEPDPENYPFVREGMMTIRGQDYAKDPQALLDYRHRMGGRCWRSSWRGNRDNNGRSR